MNTAIEDREKLFASLSAKNIETFFSAVKKGPKSLMGPSTFAVPYQWKYSLTRKVLYELADYLNPEEAERRNIDLVNPVLKEIMPVAIAPTLCASIQLVRPREVAPAHRHSANAFRLVLESPPDGAYTVVNGCKLTMHTGDLILTPNWTWHDHHNDSDSDVIWFDGLDIPLIRWIGAMSFESSSEESQKVTRSSDDVLAQYGSGMKPISNAIDNYTPLLYYPYERSKESLRRWGNATAAQGNKYTVIEYVNPLTGRSVLDTMSLKLHRIDPSSKTNLMRKMGNMVVLALEGRGTITLGDGKKFEMDKFDVAIIPPWTQYQITNDGNEQLILFSFSDEPIFKAAGVYREEEIQSPRGS